MKKKKCLFDIYMYDNECVTIDNNLHIKYTIKMKFLILCNNTMNIDYIYAYYMFIINLRL